jgi:hypothetical protein
MENQAPEVPPKPPVVPGMPSDQQPNRPAHAATNGLAIAGMVMGIVAFISGWVPFFGFVIAVVAIILSVLALRKGTQKGMAITGLVTGGIGLIWSLIVGAIVIIGIMAGVASFNGALSSQEKTQDTQNTNETKTDEGSVEDQEVLMGWQIKINSVTKDVTLGGETSEDAPRYIAVNMTVKNVSDELDRVSTLPYALNAFRYTSKIDQKVYSGSVRKDVEIKPSLVNMPLKRGETGTGNFLFVQPPEGTALMLVYTYAETVDGKTSAKEKKFDLNNYIQ